MTPTLASPGTRTTSAAADLAPSAGPRPDAPGLPRPPAPPRPRAPLPNSRTLRLAAEWASGVRAVPLWFSYDGWLGVALEPPTTTAFGPVRTSADAHRPYRLDALSLTVAGQEEPLVIGADRQCALFWSESAVEKFLLPYMASVAAWDSGAFLIHALLKAWYGYSADRVQVVALALACGPGVEPGVVTMADLVNVVFAPVEPGGLGTLRMRALSEFLDQPGFVGPERGPPAAPAERVPGVLGSVALRSRPAWAAGDLGSIPCRELAEFASGIRDQYLSFVPAGGEMQVVACPGPDPCGVVGEAFGCLTQRRRPDRPAVEALSAVVNGEIAPMVGFSDPLTSVAPDALFWTAGAVEKLMVPYYASVTGRSSPFSVPRLLGKWDGIIPPTGPGGEEQAVQVLQTVLDSAPPADTPFSSQVFAVAHLPRSEYVPEEDSGGGGSVSRSASLLLEDRTYMLRYDGQRFMADRVGRAPGAPLQ
ncbi:MAG: hypothetical protein JWM27_3301 [Gemmatimonadetes bacterium]|nr:hypothetical protein [Gemmatimonadota bacterium]